MRVFLDANILFSAAKSFSVFVRHVKAPVPPCFARTRSVIMTGPATSRPL